MPIITEWNICEDLSQEVLKITGRDPHEDIDYSRNQVSRILAAVTGATTKSLGMEPPHQAIMESTDNHSVSLTLCYKNQGRDGLTARMVDRRRQFLTLSV